MMKLRRLGSALALLCVISLLFAAYEAYRLSQAREFNRRIVSAIDTAATQDSPEAEFARALSLSAHDDYEGAVRAYKELSRTSEGSLLQSVLYNLGNLHLREALKYGPDEIGRSLPLAPEREDVSVEAPPLPQNSERAVTTMKAFTLGLP